MKTFAVKQAKRHIKLLKKPPYAPEQVFSSGYQRAVFQRLNYNGRQPRLGNSLFPFHVNNRLKLVPRTLCECSNLRSPIPFYFIKN